MHKGPGPVYALHGVTGYNDHCTTKRRLPAYSMAGRGKEFSDDCSPGPKYAIEKGYTRNGPDGTPKVGISGRNKDLTSFQTPSPDKYSVDAAGRQVYKSQPAYSMSSRTKQSKSDNTPAPNAYSLPTTLGDKLVDKKTCPAYSLRSRPAQGGFSEDLQRTPGPGAYKVTEPSTYKQKAPGYTMCGRNEVPGDTTTKPGPGAHKPENVYLHKKAAPAFSFGQRHTEYMAPLIDNVED
jgi:hypothetical protein